MRASATSSANGYETARQILSERRTKMDQVVERLKVVETIDAAELEQILNDSSANDAAKKKESLLSGSDRDRQGPSRHLAGGGVGGFSPGGPGA